MSPDSFRGQNLQYLARFAGDRPVPALVADTVERTTSPLVTASPTVSRLSETGADREAIMSRLIQPAAAAPGDAEKDPIV